MNSSFFPCLPPRTEINPRKKVRGGAKGDEGASDKATEREDGRGKGRRGKGRKRKGERGKLVVEL